MFNYFYNNRMLESIQGFNSEEVVSSRLPLLLQITMSDDTINYTLKKVKETLDIAENGYALLSNGGKNVEKTALANVTVFGRAVTNVLQKLRSQVTGFDDWYSLYQKEMSNDPLLRYFYSLRSQIIKEGEYNLERTLYINHFKASDIDRIERPPGAVAFFMNDEIGGSGWMVNQPDGSEAKYYVELPPDIGWISFEFSNPPDTFLGNRIYDNSIRGLCRLYLNYLHQMVDDACNKFVKA